MACPATIWMVILFPMEATCWKKMTAQYPDRPAQAAQACSGTAQLPAELWQGARGRCLGRDSLCWSIHKSALLALDRTHGAQKCQRHVLLNCCAGHAWRGA